MGASSSQDDAQLHWPGRKRRRRGKSTTDVDRALYPNHVWSYDFVADQTIDGRRLRFLTVIDEFTREAIWIECGRLLNSHDVVAS